MKILLHSSKAPIFKIFALFVLVLNFNHGYSQIGTSLSSVKISNVIFIVDKKDTLDFETVTKRGISHPDTVLVRIFFDKESIEKSPKTDYSFDFQLYRNVAISWMLNSNQLVRYKFESGKIVEGKNNYIEMKYGDLKPGVWKIQVLSWADRGFLSFKGQTEFYLLIK